MSMKRGFTNEGYQRVFVTKTFEQVSHTIASINFANRRTWWPGATRHTASLSPVGSVVQLDSELVCVHEIPDGSSIVHYYTSSDYEVQVRVDGETLQNKEYGYESGMPANVDPMAYQVDYATGTLTFNSSLAGKSVEVDYSLPGPGYFKLCPPSGKLWRVHHIELQFSTSHTAWTNPMEFCGGLAHPAVAGGAEILGTKKKYRGMADILNFANLGTLVPACGELTSDVYQIPFSYLTGYSLYPAGYAFDLSTPHAASFLRLCVKYGLPFENCELASATFYVLEEPL